MRELKPCPFCGNEPVVEGNLVACNNLNCPTYDNYWTDPMIFTCDQWNTRPIEDALQAENEWLKECNDVATPIDVALRKRIAELEAAQRWIPVSERLPEIETDRVLIRRGNIVALGWVYFDELMGDWDYRCYDEDWDGNPTHWMLLPKFPEVQE